MSINKAILIGNVGLDPELRQTNSNQAVINLRVATHDRFTSSNGEKVEHTEWHTVVAFGRLAELCSTYLNKGSRIYVEGRLRSRKWTTQEGVEKYTTEIVANSIEFLDRPPRAETTTTQEAPQMVNVN
jgi:single-strand DNA-binding protein